MLKRSLITLFVTVIVYFAIQLVFASFLAKSPWINQSLSIFYVWIPGLVGVFFGKQEGIPLPIFSRPNKWIYLTPVITLAIAFFGLALSIPFGGAQLTNPQFAGQSVASVILYSFVFLTVGLFFSSILLSFLFLGGELYWRGYLWEKLKGRGHLKAIFLIALIWSLWQLPASLLSNRLTNLPYIYVVCSLLILNFALAPVLTWFRLKTKSIIGPAFFYSMLVSSFLFVMMLFPVSDFKMIAITGGFDLIGIFLFSLIFKLYKSETWKKLV